MRFGESLKRVLGQVSDSAQTRGARDADGDSKEPAKQKQGNIPREKPEFGEGIEVSAMSGGQGMLVHHDLESSGGLGKPRQGHGFAFAKEQLLQVHAVQLANKFPILMGE